MGRVEAVFGSAGRVAVLRVMAEATEELTGRGVWEGVRGSEDAPRALGTVQRALDELVDAGVVTWRGAIGSSARLYSLDRLDPFVARGVLPLLEMDRPIDDPARALRRLLEGEEEAIGIYKAALEDPLTTPGELVLHYVVRAGGAAADTDATERVRRLACWVGDRVGRTVRLSALSFQEARDRARDDPDFRDRVVTRGVHLAGTSFASGY